MSLDFTVFGLSGRKFEESISEINSMGFDRKIVFPPAIAELVSILEHYHSGYQDDGDAIYVYLGMEEIIYYRSKKQLLPFYLLADYYANFFSELPTVNPRIHFLERSTVLSKIEILELLNWLKKAMQALFTDSIPVDRDLQGFMQSPLSRYPEMQDLEWLYPLLKQWIQKIETAPYQHFYWEIA
ncbi:MAG: hypothetical protein GYB31_00315 [Bacteroidetes bacterium]|nr:hypothetical protein [Bacteroidota bacterium]